MPVVDADPGEAGEVVEVHQVRRPNQAEVEQGHEALAAGQDLRVLAVLRQDLERLVDGAWNQVIEPRWLHRNAAGLYFTSDKRAGRRLCPWTTTSAWEPRAG